MKLGAHLSITGGISQAVETAKEIGANTLQIFSGPPRNWGQPKIGKSEVEKFRNLAKKYNVSPIFIHSKYLVNLASNNPLTIKRSIHSLINDLKIAAKIGAKGVIFHPRFQNFDLLVKSINQVLAQSPKSSFLILENSAQARLEEIGKIIKTVASPRLKFCFDLAHAFQAGYDLTQSKGLERVFKIIKKEIGFNHWIVIHANDSKTLCGSKNDRHEDIGKGKLGLVPFFVFLNHPISLKLPFILETPGFKQEGLAADKKNLAMLKKLRFNLVN